MASAPPLVGTLAAGCRPEFGASVQRAARSGPAACAGAAHSPTRIPCAGRRPNRGAPVPRLGSDRDQQLIARRAATTRLVPSARNGGRRRRIRAVAPGEPDLSGLRADYGTSVGRDRHRTGDRGRLLPHAQPAGSTRSPRPPPPPPNVV